MKRLTEIAFLAMVLGGTLMGCRYSDAEDNGGITTDLITNNRTASGDYDESNPAEISFEVAKY